MNNTKVFFIGSQETGFKAFETLLSNGINIVGCFSLKPAPHENWECNVSDLANKHSIPLWEFEDNLTNSEKSETINHKKYVNIIKKLNPDLIFVLGWRQIIGEEIRLIPKIGVVGIHFSLLPKLRGHAPVSWSIISGEEETGLTLFFFEKGADKGDIIVQKKVKITSNDTSSSLRKLLIEATEKAINDMCTFISKDNIPRTKQKDNGASIAAYRLPWHGEIDWSKSSLEIYNEIRATSHPYPGSYTFLNGKKIIIWKSNLLPNTPKFIGKPGQIVLKNSKGLTVVTKDHALLITELQLEDNDTISASDLNVTTKDSFGLDVMSEITKLRRELRSLKDSFDSLIIEKKS